MLNAYVFYGGVVMLLLGIHRFSRPDSAASRVLPFLVFFCVCAGSVENGSDWIWYRQSFFDLERFEALGDAWRESVYEPGFLFLMYGIHALGLSYQWVIAAVALACSACWWYFARALRILSPALLIAFLLVIDGWTLYNEQLRQAVAVSVCLPVLVWARDGRWMRVLAGTALAVSFHASAIFVIPMLVLQACTIKCPWFWRSWGMLAGYAAAVWAVIGITVSFVRAELFSMIGLQVVQTKLSVYLESESYGAPLISAGMVSYAIGLYVVVLSRRLVAERGDGWLRLIWHFSAMWCVLGPIFRMVGVFVRFEHFLLVFLVPLCAFVWQAAGARPFDVWVRRCSLIFFAGVFFLRLSLNPEQHVWIGNYQNLFVNFFVGDRWNTYERQDAVCTNLESNENGFCQYGVLKY